MDYTTFLSEFNKTRTLPVATETRASDRGGTEKRDFDLKSAEAQRIFVWGNSDPSGIVVNDDTILSSTPFFCAMRYVSEGIAMLDRKVRRLEGERFYDDQTHPISFLMRRRPNPWMTWFDLLCAWICNAMLGNGYLLIIWDSITARPSSIEHIPSRFVWPEFDANGFLWYRISGEINGRQVTTMVPHTDILHLKGLSLDGLSGRKTSIVHKSAHGISLASDIYSESVFDKGAFPSIAVKTTDTLDSTEIANVEQNLMDRMGGAKKAGRPLVLDNGQDVQYLQWSPIDVALEQVKHMSAEQVSQMTKVPRDLLALDTHGTYGAAVQRSKDFFVHCLQPWVEKIQEELNTKLFSEPEITLGTVCFEFDSSLYLSVSPKEQTEMFEVAIRSSQMTPNEARQAQGRDAMPGGDTLYGDINTLPLEQLVEVAFAKYLSSVGEGAKSQSDQNTAKSNQKSQKATDNEQQTQPAKS
jgi:HK97 family phage portal protein